MYAVDLFNKELSNLKADWRLVDTPEIIADNYNLYLASKKTGEPKDDYPGKLYLMLPIILGLALLTKVKPLTYTRFSLCCFSSAFVAYKVSVNVP